MRRQMVVIGVVSIVCTLLLNGCMTVKTDENSDMDDETVITYETIEFPEDETIETRVPNPYVTMYLESTVYEPDGIVKFHIVDPTNTGFMTNKFLELWEWDGEEWVKKLRASTKYTPVIYSATPNADGTPIDVVGTVYLSNYKDVQRGKRYKIALGIDGQLFEEEFTIAVQ